MPGSHVDSPWAAARGFWAGDPRRLPAVGGSRRSPPRAPSSMPLSAPLLPQIARSSNQTKRTVDEYGSPK